MHSNCTLRQTHTMAAIMSRLKTAEVYYYTDKG